MLEPTIDKTATTHLRPRRYCVLKNISQPFFCVFLGRDAEDTARATAGITTNRSGARYISLRFRLRTVVSLPLGDCIEIISAPPEFIKLPMLACCAPLITYLLGIKNVYIIYNIRHTHDQCVLYNNVVVLIIAVPA